MFVWQVHHPSVLMVPHEPLVEYYVNVFNHADGADPIHIAPRVGKVYVYQSPQVSDPKNCETSIKCEVTPQIKPVLKALAWRFSPVSSKLYFLIYVQQKNEILC